MSRRIWVTIPALLALTALQPPSTRAHPRTPSAELGAASTTRSESPAREVPVRALVPETTSRSLPPTPFHRTTPSLISLTVVVVAASPAPLVNRAPAIPTIVLPLSRAPPVHS